MFEDMLTGRIPIEGRNLLVTFDDGFKSNLQISKEVLEPLDIKAIFFLCYDVYSEGKIDYKYLLALALKYSACCQL